MIIQLACSQRNNALRTRQFTNLKPRVSFLRFEIKLILILRVVRYSRKTRQQEMLFGTREDAYSSNYSSSEG